MQHNLPLSLHLQYIPAANPHTMVRIIFTGGSGKAGRHVIPYLIGQGHKVLNLDLSPFPDPSVPVYTMKTDLTESGQVFNAFTSLFSMDEYGLPDDPKERQPGGYLGVPDVVIHFAAYARDMIVPDNETFRANTQSTYNVIEAACKLGVKKIIVASSETTYGVCFTQGDSDYHSYPLTEDYKVDPMDTYALSKIVGEETARSFARRYAKAHDGAGVDIYAIRIGNVIEPHEYVQNFPTFLLDLPSRKRNAWSYIDARDLGKICHLAIQKSGLGFQVFNATNTTASCLLPTPTLLKLCDPNTPISRKMTDTEGPLSNEKIRKVLGFEDTKEWKWDEELKKGGVDLDKLRNELVDKLRKEGKDVKL